MAAPGDYSAYKSGRGAALYQKLLTEFRAHPRESPGARGAYLAQAGKIASGGCGEPVANYFKRIGGDLGHFEYGGGGAARRSIVKRSTRR
jgi:hypothetical protein